MQSSLLVKRALTIFLNTKTLLNNRERESSSPFKITSDLSMISGYCDKIFYERTVKAYKAYY